MLNDEHLAHATNPSGFENPNQTKLDLPDLRSSSPQGSTQYQQQLDVNPKQEAQKKHTRPDQIAFVDPNYTYASRERDLVLMENLLSSRLEETQMELALLRHSIYSGSFENNV